MPMFENTTWLKKPKAIDKQSVIISIRVAHKKLSFPFIFTLYYIDSFDWL